MKTKLKTTIRCALALLLAMCLTQTGCGKRNGGGGGSGSGAKTVIQNAGSDTMVNLAQAWAEEYAKIEPSVSVEVSGGGSGTGVAALINGTVDIANSSRELESNEVVRAKANTGKEPKEYLVGYDALAIYVHKGNPLNEISLDQLLGIYGEGGAITKWSQLGIKNEKCNSDEIVLVSRQNNSGTYHYFREHVLKKKDFKLGTKDMHGSKDVVELVSNTPCAIGYSGLGYATPEVKIVKVSKAQGQPAIQPSIESTLNKTYPIARPMFMYTPGSPPAHVQKYLDWIVTDAGQRIVEQTGYVPLPKK